MPPAKDPDSLNRLKIVYGAMPPHLTPEYLKTERFIKQLKVRKESSVVASLTARQGNFSTKMY